MDGYVASLHSSAMVSVAFLITFLPVWVDCAGDGNIRLLEDEVAAALKSCINQDSINSRRQRRSDESYDGSARIDHVMKQINTYSHERRNFNDTRDRFLNTSDYNYEGYENSNKEESLTSFPPPAVADETNVSAVNVNRTKRNEPLIIKPDSEQCLSQCVFANLQVVDPRGIPREKELWNKVQASVTSQQSRSALRDQIQACFRELQSEAEDDGCSYSNKLERCLMLRFLDRKPRTSHTNENQEKNKNQSRN